MDRHLLVDANPDPDLDRHQDGNSDRDRHKKRCRSTTLELRISTHFLPDVRSESWDKKLQINNMQKCNVADPGCLSRIPDPDFYPSRIMDLGSRIPDPKTATKERGEKNLLSYLFLEP